MRRSLGLVFGILIRTILESQITVAILAPNAVSAQSAYGDADDNPRPQIWEEFGHKFKAGELEELKKSVADMALSRVEGDDELYLGG